MKYSCYIIITLTISGIFLAEAKRQRYVTVDTCSCNNAACSCCFTNNFQIIPAQEVCVEFNGIPNQLCVQAALKFNDETVLSKTLDPSSLPICVPQIPGLCLVVNHVDLSENQLCIKLQQSALTLVKFPCLSSKNGKFVLEKNNYE